MDKELFVVTLQTFADPRSYGESAPERKVFGPADKASCERFKADSEYGRSFGAGYAGGFLTIKRAHVSW